jgi:hypothetical protein
MKNRIKDIHLEELNSLEVSHPIILACKALRKEPLRWLSEQSLERMEERKAKGEKLSQIPCLDSLPELPIEPVKEICAALGIETWCVPKKSALGSNFTSMQFFKAPHSEWVSIWLYLSFKFPQERSSSWFLLDDRFICLDRLTIREIFFNTEVWHNFLKQNEIPLTYPTCFYVTTSYKKHGLIISKLNRSDSQNFVLFETRMVNASDKEKVLEWWVKLNYYLRLGFSRPILETLNCSPFLIQKIGFKHWLDFYEWAKDKHLSSLYSFLLYLLPSQEEIKKEG